MEVTVAEAELKLMYDLTACWDQYKALPTKHGWHEQERRNTFMRNINNCHALVAARAGFRAIEEQRKNDDK